MSEVKEHIKSRSVWLRGLFILIFGIIWAVAEIVLCVVVLFQFLTVLFTGKTNFQLVEFGDKLSRYFADMVRFVTFNTDQKPFPFAERDENGEDGESKPVEVEEQPPKSPPAS